MANRINQVLLIFCAFVFLKIILAAFEAGPSIREPAIFALGGALGEMIGRADEQKGRARK